MNFDKIISIDITFLRIIELCFFYKLYVMKIDWHFHTSTLAQVKLTVYDICN